MCLVGCTSLLYHSSYNEILRTLDVCSNVSLGTYFILQEVPFNLWVTRLSWGLLSVFGFLNSADTTANENPLLHGILVHVPVLSVFFYMYCQRMILCLLVKAPTHFTRPTARGPSPRHPPTTLRFPAWSSSPCSETHRAGSAPRTVSSWGVSSDARGRGVCR